MIIASPVILLHARRVPLFFPGGELAAQLGGLVLRQRAGSSGRILARHVLGDVQELVLGRFGQDLHFLEDFLRRAHRERVKPE